MNFKDKYTTTEIKASVATDKDKTEDEKKKENLKSVVSNDTFLNAEMIQNLINVIDNVRLR